MTESSCRWGILSTAAIARKNWHAILNSGNGSIVAVASRSVDKAATFIDECQSQFPFPEKPTPMGSYDELIARDDINAVYVPLPTGVRKEWVIRAAEAGKHVLCEKPCAITAEDLQEMIQVCETNRVQFMDGVMYTHSTRLPAIRDELKDDAIGELRRIACQFSFNAPPEFFQGGNIRSQSNLEPHGCLGDLGWYCIRFALWTMEYALPETVSARLISAIGGTEAPDSVPTELSAEMNFPGGITAGFYCSFRTENQQWVDLSGTSGHLTLQDFVLPFYGDSLHFQIYNSEFVTNNCQFDMRAGLRDVRVQEYGNNHPSAQETNLFREFNSLVNEERVDPHWPMISFRTQQVMDACLQSARRDGARVNF